MKCLLYGHFKQDKKGQSVKQALIRVYRVSTRSQKNQAWKKNKKKQTSFLPKHTFSSYTIKNKFCLNYIKAPSNLEAPSFVHVTRQALTVPRPALVNSNSNFLLRPSLKGLLGKSLLGKSFLAQILWSTCPSYREHTALQCTDMSTSSLHIEKFCMTTFRPSLSPC